MPVQMKGVKMNTMQFGYEISTLCNGIEFCETDPIHVISAQLDRLLQAASLFYNITEESVEVFMRRLNKFSQDGVIDVAEFLDNAPEWLITAAEKMSIDAGFAITEYIQNIHMQQTSLSETKFLACELELDQEFAL